MIFLWKVLISWKSIFSSGFYLTWYKSCTSGNSKTFMSSKDWCSTAWELRPCRGRYCTAHHVEHFRSKVNIVAIPLGADRVLSLKKGGPHKQGKERLGYTYLSERESRWEMDKRSGSPTAPPPPAILNKHLAQCTLPRTAMCCHSSFTTALFPFPFSVS